MPITLLNKSFADEFRGDSLTFLKSNAGDKTEMRLFFRSNILFRSGVGISAFVDGAGKSIDSSVNFEDEGFRVGDEVLYEVLDSSGSTIFAESSTVTLADGTHIELSDLSQIPDVLNSEQVRLRVRQRDGSGTYLRIREGLIVNFNQVPNDEAGTPFSLIDNEPTRYSFDLRTLTGSGDLFGTSIGKRSGSAVWKCKITDETRAEAGDSQFDLYYSLYIDFTNTGMFTPSSFETSNCLKSFVEFEFQSLFGEPFNTLKFVFNENADTGYYNEAYNNEQTDAFALTSVTELSISEPTEFKAQIQYTGASTDYGIGGCYLPKDSAYYQSKFEEQYLLSMFAVTQGGAIPLAITSELNPSGASFNLELLSVSNVGDVFDFKMAFTPNANLTTFLNTRDEDDRTFLIWVRIGEQNVLVAEAQAKVLSTYGGEIKMRKHKILDHSENVQNTSEAISGINSDTEDDLAFVATFKVDRNSDFSNFTARIQAKNTDNDAEFTLVQANFNLSEIPNIDGVKPIDLSVVINGNLPTTSAKISAQLVRYPLLDDVNYYGMKIYLPWVNRWEYWLQQLNANNAFYGQKTKNWVPYANTADWTLQVVVEMIQDGFLYDYVNDFNNYEYNNSEFITSEINLLALDESPLSVIPAGDQIIIESLHETQTGEPWDTENTWAMITVEPYESAQRWIASSVINFDSNASNPLSAITGTKATLDFLSADKIARLRCYFDSNKINLANGVKFTAKVKGQLKDSGGLVKQERIFQKFDAVRFPQTFTEQNRGVKTCCDSIVVASTTSEGWKNDVTSAWIKLSSNADTCNFYVLKDGEIVREYAEVEFPNQPNAYYATVIWQDILNNFGVGCYSIEVQYSIAGVEGTLQWGEYELIEYSIEACLHQARIRAIFNSNQEIDGINFTGANVESAIRFYGFIGNRQPNTEVNNLIYNNREMRSVIRENLNEYEIITDPLCDCLTKQIVDLFLLSENELFITDYNSFNHSYRYLDTPVILKETAQFTYNDLSRLASIRAVVSDKFRNQRTFY